MRVFVTHNPEDRDAYFGRSLPRLESIAEVVVNPTDHDLSTPDLVQAADGCHIVIAHRSTPGEPELFAQSPELIAMFRCAIDVSTIDIDSASANGVLIANADKSFIASTAELALGLLLDVARNISASAVEYRAEREPGQRSGMQLAGSTAGIIGHGAIGQHLSQLLSAIGMRVLIHDPVAPADHPLESVSLPELLSTSDFVIPLTPGGEENRNLIGAPELALMRPGTYLVNVSRGEVLDEDAVLSALESGHLAGLGIDVGQADDQRPSMRLAKHPHVVATPHLGGLTPANADAQAASAVDQVEAILNGTMPPRSLNPDSASRLQAWWKR
jgi:D-3-phosphoglycerate dehydrogenase